MQVPVSTDPGPDKRSAADSRAAYQAQTGLVLSMESQLRLRALYEFLDGCRLVLDAIRADLSLFDPQSGNLEPLRRAARRLGGFSLEADSWGFDTIYEIASRLQILLMESGGRPGGGFWNSVRAALDLLSRLLDQCESDYRRRLEVADMLECLDQAARA